MPNDIRKTLEEVYGFLFCADLIDDIVRVGIIQEVSSGQMITDVGDALHGVPLLISGAIKVLRVDSEDNELLVYFLERGDSCAMTLSCFSGKIMKSSIRAITEKDTVIINVPMKEVSSWMHKYPDWSTFVLESFSIRLNEMLDSLDALAFLDLPDRVKRHLGEKVKLHGSTTLSTTHADIAADLHTSRVVISRVLKQLEKEGVVDLSRNKVEVLKY